MNSKRIAALILVFYAAIFLAVTFHNHLNEHQGNQCNICQILHAPGVTPSLNDCSHDQNVQGNSIHIFQFVRRTLLISPKSQRAPPAI